MNHRIGYACINTSISATTNKTCKLSNCTEERLRSLISSNMEGLGKVLEWNNDHNIYLYRISSMIIPFASHPVNKIRWWKENKAQFEYLGNFIRDNNMRVSMHPGQYVNINSPNSDIVKSSVNEIEWHIKFLDSLCVDSTNRVLIHVGGAYDDKVNAMKRFIKEYEKLPENIKSRLSLENDDKIYTVWDVLKISKETGIPIIFDILHHQINNTGLDIDDNIEYILKLCFSTWNKNTGIPKIHFSTQKPGARAGSHADSINMDDFVEFYFRFNKFDFDIMFETKDKEKSVLEAFKNLKLRILGAD